MKKTLLAYYLLTGVFSICLTIKSHADVNPGDTITKENVAQAETLLTPATRWMVEHGMTMSIIATKKVHWPKAYQDATEKYAAQVIIDPDGRDIANYVAGCPFPTIDINDPLAGFKVIWNHEQPPYLIDNLGVEYVAELVDNSGSVARTYESTFHQLMWMGRLYTEPKPTIAHNPPLRRTEWFGPLTQPNDLKGLVSILFRYTPRDTADDIYVYAPERRKVARVSIANRSDALGGSDFDFDSFYGFNGNIPHWTFRILAEKELLAVVHSGKYGDSSAWCAPRDGKHGILSALPCVSWEKRRVWIIEGTPTAYPREYGYSKRVLYMDQDFFAPLIQEMHDQNGELWKAMVGCISYTTKPYEGYPARPLAGGKYNYEDEWPFTSHWALVDLQTGSATTGDSPPANKQPSEWRTEWYFNEPIPNNTPEVYSPNYLTRSGH